MRVLVWQTYGDVHVYAAETPMQYFKLHEALVAQMTGWGEDEALARLFEAMGTATSRGKAELMFMNFVRPHVGTHETFELFEFSDVKNT